MNIKKFFSLIRIINKLQNSSTEIRPTNWLGLGKAAISMGILLFLSACAHEAIHHQPSEQFTKAEKVKQKKDLKTFDIIGNTDGENDLNYEQYLDVIPFSFEDKYAVKGKTYSVKIDMDYKEVGLASWYGGSFHGKKTASGVKFDKSLFTAAHRTLPIPSVARVVNLNNQRSVLVVINDRGPFSDERRIIDLSKSSAEHLGMLGKGIEKVRVEYLFNETKELINKLPKLQQEKALLAYQKALTIQVANANIKGASLQN